MSGEVAYASSKRGRSRGVLHTDPECPALGRVPDEWIIERPRESFDPDQPYCKVCVGGAPDE